MKNKEKIILYSNGASYFSEQMREWLKKNRIEYIEKDAGENAEELFEVSGQYAAPVLMVGKKAVLGFNEEELQKVFA